LCAQTETNTASAVPQGSECIAAIPPPDAKSLEIHPGSANRVYEIKFDDLPALRALPDRAVEVSPLALAEKHVVRIISDGKQLASFTFRFEEFATNEVCLVFDDFHEAWSLIDCENARGLRTCHPPYKLPWVEVKSCQVVGTRVVPANGQFYTDYRIKYLAEGKEFVKYVSSGLEPEAKAPSGKSSRALPTECHYDIRFHPGMADKARVSLHR